MKTLTNNQSNELLFIDNKTLLSTIIEGELIQLGSTDSTPIPISIKSIDCFTITYEVSLESNQLRNATYLLNVLNPDGGIISSTTVRVDGNTEPNRAYVVLDSGAGSSSTGGSTGGGQETTPGAPVIYASDKYYIKLDEPYSLYIMAINEPTSYSVTGLIDGLSFDTTTGRITGTVTGSDRLESMSITATNDLGSDSKLIYFYITSDDASVFHPPSNYRVYEVRTSSWYFIGWEYRPYSGEVESTTTYKNGVQYRVSVNGGNGRKYIGVPVPNLTNNVNTYQSKFTDTDGNVSRYSDKLLVNGIEAQHVTYFESVSTYENLLSVPTIKPTQIYYIQKDVSFEFDVNSFIHQNPTSYSLFAYFSTGINADGSTYELAGSFDEDTGILTSLATGDLSGFDEYGNLTGIQATNANGVSVSEYIKFKYVDYNPNDLRKPKNVILETVEEDYLTWEYDSYNKHIPEIEIYKNDVLLKIVINNNTKGKVIGTGVDNTSGDTWKIRFRDIDGLESDFSDTI